MNILDELLERLERIEEKLDARKPEPRQEKTPRAWMQPIDMAKKYNLSLNSINQLIKAGKEAGVVRSGAFSVCPGGRVLVRVEPSSFERYLEMGGHTQLAREVVA